MNKMSNQFKEKFNNSIQNLSTADSIVDSIINTFEKLSVDPGVNCNFDEIKIENSNIGENKSFDNSQKKKLLDQIESLHCLFTWKLKSQDEQDIIKLIKNKYNDSNLDISLPEFTFARFIGSLIISYELYLNGDSDASDMKILEISKWLEMLDNGTDDFYLSINIGLKHIKMANFIHKQYAANDFRGFKQLFEEIVQFDDMDNKSKAAIYAIHAAILIEYGENLDYFENACEYAKKACILDPETSQWFHIYSFVLIAQRQFLHTKDKTFLHLNKLYLTEDEIILAIKKAIISSPKKSSCCVNSLVLTTLNQFQMESNKVSVLKKHTSELNIKPNLEEDMKIIVEKHKNGEDAIPYLTVLVSKYKHDRWKIISQICSYTILFTNNFKAGVQQFLMLIEEPEISTNELIMKHNSPFINESKQFNLAELIHSEIGFITENSNDISIEDILFYYKIFLKIENMCITKMKIGISSFRTNIINKLFTKSSCSSTSTIYQDKINSSINESDSSSKSTCSSVLNQDDYDKSNNKSGIDKKKKRIRKKKICKRKKHLKNTGPKLFTNRSELNKKNCTSEQHPKTKSILKNTINEKYLMDCSISNVIPSGNISSNKVYPGLFQNLNTFQLQTEMYNLQQQNLPNITTENSNTHFNQQFVHFDFLQKSQLSTKLPSLLDLKLDLLFPPYLSNMSINNNTFNSDSMTINTSLSKLPRLSTSQKTYNLFLKCILLNYPNSFKIYTDASKIQNNVGIAMVSDKDMYTYKLSSEYTSSDAEAVAILLALDYALNENYNEYLILTDSLTTVTCIQNKNISSDVINSIFYLIYVNQLKGKRIHFIWIPSHNSIDGNEKADKLAKRIATSSTAITYAHNSFIKTKVK